MRGDTARRAARRSAGDARRRRRRAGVRCAHDAAQGRIVPLRAALCGEADEAFEIVQQSFVAVWQALHRYDPTRRFDTWLRAIALNKCRDHARRATVRRLLTFPSMAVEAQDVADTRLDAEAQWIADEGLSALDRAITLLPRTLKEPLLLTVFEGLSQAEAGREPGISAKAVETRVYRARGKLKRALRAESIENEDHMA